MIYRILLLAGLTSYIGCAPAPKPERNWKASDTLVSVVEPAAPGFVYQENLVKGTDTSMFYIETEPRMKIEDVICQRWELVDVSNVRDIEGQESEDLTRKFDELCLFDDYQFLEGPREAVRVGKWKVAIKGKALLLNLTYSNKRNSQYVIRSISADRMELMEKKPSGHYVRLVLNSDAMVHEDQRNDPFHPANNTWRIPPAKKETDAQVKARVRDCVKFFALFYRDNIKREQSEISFRGLPKIFKWYSGGIGLDERLEVDDSWIDCFYNKEQAMKGYEIIRKLITENKYDWHKEAPNWILQTHSVLEQMYDASL